MRKPIFFLVFLALVLQLSACARIREAQNRKNLLRLQVGMSKSQVLEIMGEPRKTEAYPIKGDKWEFWIYVTENPDIVVIEGRGPQSYLTPLAFQHGRLIGWGRNFYDDIIKLK